MLRFTVSDGTGSLRVRFFATDGEAQDVVFFSALQRITVLYLSDLSHFGAPWPGSRIFGQGLVSDRRFAVFEPAGRIR